MLILRGYVLFQLLASLTLARSGVSDSASVQAQLYSVRRHHWWYNSMFPLARATCHYALSVGVALCVHLVVLCFSELFVWFQIYK